MTLKLGSPQAVILTKQKTPKGPGRVSAFTSLASNINNEGKKGVQKSKENSMRMSEVVARKGAGGLTSRATTAVKEEMAQNSNADKAIRRKSGGAYKVNEIKGEIAGPAQSCSLKELNSN